MNVRKNSPPITKKVKKFPAINLKVTKPQFKFLIAVYWLMQQSYNVFSSSER